MTIASSKSKRGRSTLKPKPILDRTLLLGALEEHSINLKAHQVDGFYGDLHRLGYPDLPHYVELYSNQQRRHQEEKKSCSTPADEHLMARDIHTNIVFSLKQLPLKFVHFLRNTKEFSTTTSTIDIAAPSNDNKTTKLAIRLQDGHLVESVIMRHRHENTEGRVDTRVTLCVSSQVGCAMGCTFCATGTMGIRGNLCTGEILEQLVHAERLLREEEKQSDEERAGMIFVGNCIRNIVFMGMGEPLNNYNNVVAAVRALLHPKLWNLRHTRVTVSTVGVTPNMKRLTKDLPEVALALSLHAPNQEMRSAIVPAAKSYPIKGLIDALDDHLMVNVKKKEDIEARKTASKKKKVMIEYVMLEGDTSSFECAHQLGKLCERRYLIVNLIPYNQTDVKDKLRCPSVEHMKEFQRIVASYGAFVYIRQTMGADVNGACGQLVVNKGKNNQIVDIEDGPFHDKNKSRRTVARYNIRSDGGADASKNNSRGKAKSDDILIRNLAIATGVAAACFLISSIVMLGHRKKA